MSEDARELDELIDDLIDDKRRYKAGKDTITINQKDLIDALRDELSEAQAEIERLQGEEKALLDYKMFVAGRFNTTDLDEINKMADGMIENGIQLVDKIKADAVRDALSNTRYDVDHLGNKMFWVGDLLKYADKLEKGE